MTTTAEERLRAAARALADESDVVPADVAATRGVILAGAVARQRRRTQFDLAVAAVMICGIASAGSLRPMLARLSASTMAPVASETMRTWDTHLRVATVVAAVAPAMMAAVVTPTREPVATSGLLVHRARVRLAPRRASSVEGAAWLARVDRRAMSFGAIANAAPVDAHVASPAIAASWSARAPFSFGRSWVMREERSARNARYATLNASEPLPRDETANEAAAVHERAGFNLNPVTLTAWR